MEGIGLRIKQLREAKKLTQADFCAKIGAKQSNLSSMETAGKKISIDVISNIVLKFDINAEWLLFGTGIMEKVSGENSLTLNEPTSTYDVAEKLCPIPILDTSVAAGLSGFMNGEYSNIDEYISLPKSMIKSGDTYVGIRVKGPSMSPTILDSDKLIVRLLDKSEWHDMPDEHVYAIVDSEGKGYLKRLKNRFDKGFIVCMSDNIDKVNYPNFNMLIEEIISLWYVEFRISAKMPNINETYYSRLKKLEDRVDLMEKTREK